MPKPFAELTERLLHAGVAPRHVRRYVAELEEHFADLEATERAAGGSAEAARTTALERLGTVDQLAGAMLGRPEMLSWTARAPWAVFGLGPFVALTVAYFAALGILLSGWHIFELGEASPFQPVHGFSVPFFGLGRLLYYAAPVLIGWGVALLAARQRLSPVLPLLGSAAVACIAAASRVHATRLDGHEHVGMGFAIGPLLPGGAAAADGPLAWCFSGALTHAGLLFALAAIPYTIWLWRNTTREHRLS